MNLIYTIILSVVLMVGLFLMLWSAVGFIQNKRFFTSAPKAAQEMIQPKTVRFKGQHAVGWLLMLLSLALMAGAVIAGAYGGMQKDFGFWQFFLRFAVMQLLLKAFDILFFDWVLLCHSNFFAHYYPEVRDIYGSEIFGYNRKSHLMQIVLMLLGSEWVISRRKRHKAGLFRVYTLCCGTYGFRLYGGMRFTFVESDIYSTANIYCPHTV